MLLISFNFFISTCASQSLEGTDLVIVPIGIKEINLSDFDKAESVILYNQTEIVEEFDKTIKLDKELLKNWAKVFRGGNRY